MSRIDGTYVIQKRNFASEPCPFCTGRVKNRPEKEFKTVVKYHHFTYPATLYLNLYSCRECAAANLKEKASARKLAMFFSAIVSLAVFMRLIHHDVFYAVLFMLLMFFLSWMLSICSCLFCPELFTERRNIIWQTSLRRNINGQQPTPKM